MPRTHCLHVDFYMSPKPATCRSRHVEVDLSTSTCRRLWRHVEVDKSPVAFYKSTDMFDL
jgi:hypothetical protein